jgi:hypothetical protein
VVAAGSNPARVAKSRTKMEIDTCPNCETGKLVEGTYTGSFLLTPETSMALESTWRGFRDGIARNVIITFLIMPKFCIIKI